jgi:dihydrofolate reductase
MVLTKPVEAIDAYITNQYLVNNNAMTGQMITMEDVESYSQFRKDGLIVAGGAKTYVKLLPYIKEFYVTHINGNYDGDVFMSSFEDTFQNRELINEFDGHKVIKYTK